VRRDPAARPRTIHLVKLAVPDAKERVVIRSSFSDLFGLQYPIMNAPMGNAAGGVLAGTVSGAGALGLIGGSGAPVGMTAAERLRREVAACRALTDRPFGVGFISTSTVLEEDGRLRVAALQDVALDEGVPVIMHSFLVPADLISEARKRGAAVICQVQTVAMAREALDAGADVLVAQGYDGGGHVGSVGTMSIVPAIVDLAGDVPVVAAGGIADGRGLAAALMLGAQGASLGTRFYASAEADAPSYVHERLVSATTDDTVWTLSYDIVRNVDFGPTVAGRVVRNGFTDAWHGRDAEARANAATLLREIDAGTKSGEASVASVWSSSAVGLIRDVEPAGAIVRGICAEAEGIIRERAVRLT
jgi:nitronate monooxygenase